MTRKVARYNKGALIIQYHLILVIFISKLAIDNRDSMNIGFIRTLNLALYIKRWKYLN